MTRVGHTVHMFTPIRTPGQVLRQVREEAGATQAELAEALDIPQSEISQIERGRRRLSSLSEEKIQQMTDALSLDEGDGRLWEAAVSEFAGGHWAGRWLLEQVFGVDP